MTALLLPPAGLLRQRHTLARLFALSVALAVFGCQAPASRVHVERSLAERPHPGYVTEQHHAITTTKETWTLADVSVEVVLTAPSATGRFPMVVYLPGLGEGSDAGAAWRQAWTEAGYVVAGAQLSRDAAAAWRSAKARAAEFDDVAKERFSRDALARRLGTLRALLREIDRRQRSGALAAWDGSRMALAGFDVGAQTAMTAAGERQSGIASFALPATVRCMLAFSPYAGFSGAPAAERFAAVSIPVMSVTGTEDADPFGVVPTPALRRVPFDHLPPGRKYLLDLVGAPHALMAGNESPPAGMSERTQDSGNPRGGPRGGGRHRGAGGGQASSHGGTGEPDAARATDNRASSGAAWRTRIADAQNVTTAYLDAVMKDDTVAQEWLAKDARRWLADRGNLVER